MGHGLINFITHQSKISSSSNIYLYSDFAAGVYMSEAPSLLMIPCPPPYTLYSISIYSRLIHTGKGGGEEYCTREKVRGATVHKAGSKIPT